MIIGSVKKNWGSFIISLWTPALRCDNKTQHSLYQSIFFTVKALLDEVLQVRK